MASYGKRMLAAALASRVRPLPIRIINLTTIKPEAQETGKKTILYRSFEVTVVHVIYKIC